MAWFSFYFIPLIVDNSEYYRIILLVLLKIQTMKTNEITNINIFIKYYPPKYGLR